MNITIDWNDPEMRELGEEFISSFAERREAIRKSLLITSSEEAAFEIRVIAHNLAGACGNYGFHALGKIAGEVDDHLSLKAENISLPELRRYSELLDQALGAAVVNRRDSVDIGANSF